MLNHQKCLQLKRPQQIVDNAKISKRIVNLRKYHRKMVKLGHLIINNQQEEKLRFTTTQNLQRFQDNRNKFFALFLN